MCSSFDFDPLLKHLEADFCREFLPMMLLLGFSFLSFSKEPMSHHLQRVNIRGSLHTKWLRLTKYLLCQVNILIDWASQVGHNKVIHRQSSTFHLLWKSFQGQSQQSWPDYSLLSKYFKASYLYEKCLSYADTKVLRPSERSNFCSFPTIISTHCWSYQKDLRLRHTTW